MENITAGLIGCGRIGYTFDLDSKRKGVWTHAGAYHASDLVKFEGIYDSNKTISQKCAKKYDVHEYSYSSQLVLDCDIISVAVPENYHKSTLEHLLNHMGGNSRTKIIWIEKPFTGNFATARQLVDNFATFNCHLHVNYQRRYCKAFEKLKNFGKPRNVQITYTRGLYNTASHFVDMILGLYGEPIRTIPITYSDFVMDYGQFRVNFTMLSKIDYNICDSTFYYSNKSVVVPPLQTNLQINASTKSGQYSEYRDLQPADSIEFGYEPMLKQVEVMAMAIKSGRYDALNRGLKTLKILEKISNDKAKLSL